MAYTHGKASVILKVKHKFPEIYFLVLPEILVPFNFIFFRKHSSGSVFTSYRIILPFSEGLYFISDSPFNLPFPEMYFSFPENVYFRNTK